jgi:hypothetical protein
MRLAAFLGYNVARRNGIKKPSLLQTINNVPVSILRSRWSIAHCVIFPLALEGCKGPREPREHRGPKGPRGP